MKKRKERRIVRYLREGLVPEKPVSTLPNFRAEAEKYKLNTRGNLVRDGKPVLKCNDLAKTWKQFHLLGHSGRDATWKKINARFYFYGGEKWIRKKISECVGCSHKKSLIWKAAKTPLKPIKVYPKAFWRVNIDLLGPIYPESESGNKYIALMVDPLTKYVEAAGNLFFCFPKDIRGVLFYRRILALFIFPRYTSVLSFSKGMSNACFTQIY